MHYNVTSNPSQIIFLLSKEKQLIIHFITDLKPIINTTPSQSHHKHIKSDQTNSPTRHLSPPLLINLLPLIQETLVELDTKTGVQATSRGTDTVHAQLGNTDIRRLDTHSTAEHRAHGTTGPAVVADHVPLVDAARKLGDAVEDGHGHTIRGHVRRGIDTKGHTDVQARRVIGQVGLGKVGVGSVGHVRRDEERVGVRLAHETGAEAGAADESILVESVGVGDESLDGALDNNGEEVTARTLAEEGANLLVVEERYELDDARVLIVTGVEEGHESGPRAELVVDAAGKDELLVDTTNLGGLRVVELELPVENVGVLLNLELGSNELDELGRLGRDEGTLGANGLLGGGCGRGVKVAVVEANDGGHLGLLVVVARHTDAEMGSQSRDTSNWKVCVSFHRMELGWGGSTYWANQA